MSLLDDKVDEAPSWKISSSGHAAHPRWGAFWEPFGHSLHGDVCPGEEPGPQMRAGDMRNLNGRS